MQSSLPMFGRWCAALAALLAVVASAASAAPPQGPTVLPAPISVSGFATPESVLYDAAGDVYLVSNINGGGLAADNNGFISRVSPAGEVLALKWIEGGVNGVTLNAPKGSAIAGGILYVADIDHVRLFDATTGLPTGSIRFAGATFLNDVASDKKGNVYVSDIGFRLNAAGTGLEPSGTDAIYRIDRRSGAVSVVAQGTALNHPNGLAVLKGGKLQVVSFDPFGNTREIYVIDKNGRRRNTLAMPAGLLDGVVALDGKDELLVSSWETSSIYGIDGDSIRVVATNLPNPADIGFDTLRRRILIPLFDANTVVIQPLGSARH
jgi:sugar lactone lactonase YvrE